MLRVRMLPAERDGERHPDMHATRDADTEASKHALHAPLVAQVAGQEVQAATSPATAFTLEKLLAAADATTLMGFLRAVLETQDAFGTLASQ